MYIYTPLFPPVPPQRADTFTLLWQEQRPVGFSLSHVSPKRARVCNFLSRAPPPLITVRANLPTEMHNAGAPPSIMQHLFIPQQYLIDLILFASCIIEQTGPRVCFLPASGCCHRPRSITETPEILKLRLEIALFGRDHELQICEVRWVDTELYWAFKSFSSKMFVLLRRIKGHRLNKACCADAAYRWSAVMKRGLMWASLFCPVLHLGDVGGEKYRLPTKSLSI